MGVVEDDLAERHESQSTTGLTNRIKTSLRSALIVSVVIRFCGDKKIQ